MKSDGIRAPESFIVYEKMTGKIFHVSAPNHNEAALIAARRIPQRHNEVRRLEVIKISDMTTIDIRFPKPELV